MFRRTDLPASPIVRARAELAVLTERHTQLGADPAAVHTVEHVLAAVAGARDRRHPHRSRCRRAADSGRQRAAVP